MSKSVKRLVLFVSLSAIEMLFMNLCLTTRLLSTFESERKTYSISKTIIISKKVVPLLILLLLNPIFTFLCIYRLKGKKDASRPLPPPPQPPLSRTRFSSSFCRCATAHPTLYPGTPINWHSSNKVCDVVVVIFFLLCAIECFIRLQYVWHVFWSNRFIALIL